MDKNAKSNSKYKAANKGEDDKVSTALARMMEEDLTLQVKN